MPRQSADCLPEEMDSNHPLYILYTSDTTAGPKGIMLTITGQSGQERLGRCVSLPKP